jgi:selenide, water dikinase
LIGHATEMARASGVTILIDAGDVPLFDGVLKIARRNQSGGMGSNRDHFASGVTVEPGVDADLESLLYDPQTSGGLLIASSAGAAERVAARLREAGVAAKPIGTVTAAHAGVSILVRR